MDINPFKEFGPRRYGFCFLMGYDAHIIFCKWIKKHRDKISNVLEVGCGSFDYYSHFFGNMKIGYTGLDINQKVIDYRKSIDSEHRFICADFTNYKSSFQYDLVFNHMPPPLSKDFLNSFVEVPKKYGYLTVWNVESISVRFIISQLKSLGCKNVLVSSVPTNLPEDVPQEEFVITWEQNEDFNL